MPHICADASPEMTVREKTNMERCRRIAADGMVLLENNGYLPMQLSGARIALFGAARRTIKGGKGSGSVNSRLSINVEQGLEKAGAVITTKNWLDRLDMHVDEEKRSFTDHLKTMVKEGTNPIMMLMANPFIEPTSIPVTVDDLASPADAAIYVISRNAGEGIDRRFVPGEYLLSDEEKDILCTLCSTYPHVVVLLNVGAVIDTAFLRSLDGIDAVLLMSQGGNIGGLAVCDVLSGAVTPSGHLTATWAERYEDHPTAATFSHRNGNTDDEYYSEGIYVGYRYFDTFGVKPAYPFGYGLSYTSFNTEVLQTEVIRQQIQLTVRVTNTGSVYSGKEVVQVYVSQPKGRIPKAYQKLVAFAKTSLLATHASQILTIAFPTDALASFDEEHSCWVAEAGDYIVRIGCHSRCTHIAAVLRVAKDAVTARVNDCLRPDEDFELLDSRNAVPYTDAKEASVLSAAPVLLLDDANFTVRQPDPAEAIVFHEAATEKLTMTDVLEGRAAPEKLIAQLTIPELASMCVGAFRYGVDTGAFGANAVTCPGAAGETNFKLQKSRSIPTVLLADGPAGLRLTSEFKTDADGNLLPSEADLCETLFGIAMGPRKTKGEEPEGTKTWYQYCTAVPIATMLAQTWDLSLLREIGDIVGGEMEHFGIALWLAPGMNIQRDPLCGRNFEYYSEDPLLSGLCAAYITLGVQSHSGCGTTIKHFACNNQEDNRMHCNAHVPLQALREIYLRGFELAVRLAQPKAIMSSYNLLNGVHTANRHDLLTTVARDEWGFKGMVMTDWSTTRQLYDDAAHTLRYPSSSAPGCILAGNDLIMPGMPLDEQDIIEAAEKGELPLDALRSCACRVLRMIAEHIAGCERHEHS